MQTTPLTYTAELEQALTATELLDRVSNPAMPWGHAALALVAARFGGAGMDLPFEFQNAVYEIELGYPAAFVLFH